MKSRKIKVLVVDDSALIRSVMKEIINRENDMECVGAAPDPLVAREMIKSLNPDVLTLDVEMPKMDGLDFLERLMRLRPMPVLMVSTLTERGSDITFRALELGAVDFVSKPKLDIARGMEEYAIGITDKIRATAQARVYKAVAQPLVQEKYSADAILPSVAGRFSSTEKLIIIGASTGGTEAIKEILTRLPADAPGVLVAQHMPEHFTKSFADRLDTLCKISVKEAEHNERILPGHAYIAPGHSHLLLKRSGANYMTRLDQGELVNRHRPSVDVLFRSAANVAGANALGIILTGMGKDGVQGLLEMKQAGSYTIAQDEASCVVFGMPKEAISAGGVSEVLPLQNIARRALEHLASQSGKSSRI
ncbi:MAG: chemotaxis response regulator protein-glutamate methylesterase [Gallionellales bacterium RIFCSPLOWO2_02_FULL_57_47]|nr:MAG: chemotaxis response regulator protein-glutamate methylesterase [Gallionellales bacterium RIFCSPLOWO2_02_FULL_57_47]OGT16603.1 MAG: chemotaxis response regulator protein-glutamate methylesterase [Gallionellales bacterium RIFCSPHIGHO2_02_FULL_57_16]